MYIIFGRKTIAVLLSSAVLLSAAALAGRGIYDNLPASTAVSSDWGLSFQTDGKAPVGNTPAEELKKYNAHYLGDTTKKKIYLTFDAGYENGYTPHILDVLKKHGVHAAFFVVGNYIKTAPELVKRMADEGHTVGNHTFSHPDMSAISSKEDFKNELESLEKLYEETTGRKMSALYRPPQGKYSKENLSMAKELGYHTIFWSLAYADWYNDRQPSDDEAMNKLIPRIHNGAVVLLHSTSQTNSRILDKLLTKWEDMGYSFGEITELTDQV